MVRVSYREHKRNKCRMATYVDILAECQELLLLTVKRRKLSWFGHICRYDKLPKIILQGAVDGSRRI